MVQRIHKMAADRQDACEVETKVIRTDVNILHSEHERLDNRYKEVLARAQKIKDSIQDCEKNTFKPPSNPLFASDPNLSILRLSFNAMVTKVAALETATAWLADYFTEPDMWELQGPELARNFVLQFKGPAQTAQRRARKAQSSLSHKDAGGSMVWTKLYAKMRGEDIEMYVSEDKNLKQRRSEFLVKKLRIAIENIIPELKAKLHAKKQDCSIKYDWIPLVKVEANEGDAPPSLLWNATHMVTAGINEQVKKKIIDNFTVLTARPQTQWGL